MKDTLRRFLFENLAVRGELVHLDETWKAVRERHDYPEPVQKLLAELMSAVVLLLATLKLKGKLIAQVQGNGPVSLMVVEGSSENTLRAVAHIKDQVKHAELENNTMQELLGDGRLVITLEPDKGERYQGIVALTGDSLADALTDYLQRSEQLDTNLWLAADGDQTAGLLIQKLPETAETTAHADIDGWNRIQQLSATITNDELLLLNAEEVIHRLYHEEDIRLFEAEGISFLCSCSRERVANMLRSLGIEEVNSILKEQNKIEVACEFCNHNYSFDAVDVAQLFAEGVISEASDTTH